MTGSEHLVCPECPACDCRRHEFRFDPDRHIGVIRCEDCDEPIFVVSVLANRHVTTVIDPMADPLPEDTYEDLKERGRLPPVAEREQVEIDVE